MSFFLKRFHGDRHFLGSLSIFQQAIHNRPRSPQKWRSSESGQSWLSSLFWRTVNEPHPIRGLLQEGWKHLPTVPGNTLAGTLHPLNWKCRTRDFWAYYNVPLSDRLGIWRIHLHLPALKVRHSYSMRLKAMILLIHFARHEVAIEIVNSRRVASRKKSRKWILKAKFPRFSLNHQHHGYCQLCSLPHKISLTLTARMATWYIVLHNS